MNFPAQELEVDLPTILVDSQDRVPGTARVGLRFDSHPDDPSRLRVNFRLLEARYVPPADCSPKIHETILRLNSALSDRLLGETPPSP